MNADPSLSGLGLSAGRSKTARLVIVEGCTLCRELLAMKMEQRMGHHLVGACATVAEAKHVVVQTRPDLVITEAALPDGSGLELLQHSPLPLQHTRWLLLSTLSRSYMVHQAVRWGVHGIVIKHSGLGTLMQAVETILNGGTFFCAQSSDIIKNGRGLSAATAKLTRRESEVLHWIAEGKRNAEIADVLGCMPATVKSHVENILRKTEAETRSAAVAAWQHMAGVGAL
jgi:DNA-binding NarL/FixJ family response regulator